MNDIRNLLEIEYPIFQGAMANIATGTFAASVSNAGGLGLIASGGFTPDGFREQIRIAKALTEKPFGVNLMLMLPEIERYSEIAVEECVRVITTGAGAPGKLLQTWKANGIKVFPVVPSVALAKRMERNGVDGVIAEGTESGGHVGSTTTMALLPQVCDAVSVPVIAAGGIASGRQMLAAYAMGAAGIQVGTVLLASEECPIHENYKKAILKAKDTDTAVTGYSVGAPVRCLKNRMTREYLEREASGATREELEMYTLGSLRRAVYDGDTERGSLMAGQVAGQLHEIRAVKEIFSSMVMEYKAELKRLSDNSFFFEE